MSMNRKDERNRYVFLVIQINQSKKGFGFVPTALLTHTQTNSVPAKVLLLRLNGLKKYYLLKFCN